MRSLFLTCFLMAMVTATSGCFHNRVVAPDPSPATEYKRKTVHTALWGLLEWNARAVNCAPSNAIDEVKIRNNIGYSLITVVALFGGYAPMSVEWRCAKPADMSALLQASPPDGELSR